MLKRSFFSLLILFPLLALSTPTDCGIIQKPIKFDQKRIVLTREYRLQHYGINTKSIRIQPKMIVLHWTMTSTLKTAFSVFYSPTLRGRRHLKKHGQLNVSAHYLVARNGQIYQMMPTNLMARHVIGLNNIAIGIENVGGQGGKENLTPAQVRANVCLIRLLKKKYPSIQYLIGHFEYLRFKNSSLWEEKNPAYKTHKIDPGKKFMRDVRQKVKDLGLKSKP